MCENNSFIEKHSILYRTEEINFLSQFFEKSGVQYRPLFIYGPSATGKTFVLSKLLKHLSKKFVWINCFEHITSVSLFNAIMQQIRKENHNKIVNVCQFINTLKMELEETSETLYLVLDSVQVLRDQDPSLIPVFMTLQKVTNVNICPIFVSRVPWDEFIDQNNPLMPVNLHFPNYSSKEMEELLKLDSPPGCKESFYAGYVNIILKTFFPVLRNLSELRRLAKLNFPKYCEPLKEDPLKEPSTVRLWKNIEPTLKSALSYVHLREAPGSIWKTYNKIEEKENIKLNNLNCSTLTQDLGCYPKFLLISAYFASFNCQKTDFKHFVKNQGKQAKKMKKKRLKKNRHLLGPKPFNLDRLMSIFYSLSGKIVIPSALMYSQISSLVNNNLIAKVSVDDKLESQTYKCLTDLQLVCKIGKTVGIDVMGYLDDYL